MGSLAGIILYTYYVSSICISADPTGVNGCVSLPVPRISFGINPPSLEHKYVNHKDLNP
jgi:hypothetical protein